MAAGSAEQMPSKSTAEYTNFRDFSTPAGSRQKKGKGPRTHLERRVALFSYKNSIFVRLAALLPDIQIHSFSRRFHPEQMPSKSAKKGAGNHPGTAPQTR